jgi:hypothetical protein
MRRRSPFWVVLDRPDRRASTANCGFTGRVIGMGAIVRLRPPVRHPRRRAGLRISGTAAILAR